MKKALSLILVLVLCLGVAAPASAAGNGINTGTITYTLDDTYVDAYGLKSDVTVKVTLTGYIGTLDMAECGIENEIYEACAWSWWNKSTEISEPRPVYVLESGSKVKFTIISDDPNAYYNYCYNEGEFDWFIYDDSNGGAAYRVDDGDISSYAYTVWPNGDGTTILSAGLFSYSTAAKTGTNSYEYSAYDGMHTFCFTAKDRNADEDSYFGVAKYVLGTFLFVGDKHRAEIEKTGAATYHKVEGGNTSYTYAWPGLAELLGIEVKDTSAKIVIDEKNGFISDAGIVYGYSVANNTAEDINGYFALLTYQPVKDYSWRVPSAQLFAIDIDLKRGETQRGSLTSTYWRLSSWEFGWIEFESKEERDAFLGQDCLHTYNGKDYNLSPSSAEAGDLWLKDNFGIIVSVENP